MYNTSNVLTITVIWLPVLNFEHILASNLTHCLFKFLASFEIPFPVLSAEIMYNTSNVLTITVIWLPVLNFEHILASAMNFCFQNLIS